MGKSRNLKPLLRSAVTLVMASSGVTGGCSDDVGPGIEDDPGFVSTSCGAHERDLLAGLRPEPEQDYLELRSLDLRDGAGGAAGGNFETIAKFGDACRTAENEAACLTTLEGVPESDGFLLGSCEGACSRYYLVATRGDSVQVLDTPQRVATLLGTIDTPEEAMLLVEMEGRAVRCRDGGAKPDGSGFIVQGYTYPGCDGVTRYLFSVGSDGSVAQREKVVLEEPNPNCIVGRRPAGLNASERRGGAGPEARYLAQAARLEAASVYAFRQVERELAAHGAPRRLRAAARRAAADEVRHARTTAALAHRFGASRLERPRVTPLATRDLESLLLDNAIEGCVRETFGVAVGMWQAKNAGDPRVAKAMRRIAADELRHARLAWEIAAWFEPKLDGAARQRVEQARRTAIADLRRELEAPIDASIVRRLGVPPVQDALRLHRELERSVWS